MPKFAVQEHQATHLHFDFRLEMEGVLKSWAVPKGPSMNPKEKRLAIMVDDHALEYAEYEGIIPEGQYGSGAVVLWDKGEYELLKGGIQEGSIEFILYGKKLKGGFLLARMSGRKKEWLLIKRKDDYAEENFIIRTMLTPAKINKLKLKVPPCSSS